MTEDKIFLICFFEYEYDDRICPFDFILNNAMHCVNTIRYLKTFHSDLSETAKIEQPGSV
jgi:hypothetical protein